MLFSRQPDISETVQHRTETVLRMKSKRHTAGMSQTKSALKKFAFTHNHKRFDIPAETVFEKAAVEWIGAEGILGKIIGCSAVARCFRYRGSDALAVGFGMIARGEVALAVYATGQSLIAYENGTLVGIDPLVATIFLIVCSSILCPITLKLAFRNHSDGDVHDEHRQVSISSEAIENVHHETTPE